MSLLIESALRNIQESFQITKLNNKIYSLNFLTTAVKIR